MQAVQQVAAGAGIGAAAGRWRGVSAALPERRWSLPLLAGRLVELSSQGDAAALTAAVALTWETQRAGEPVGWVATAARGAFFPPDAAEWGIDFSGLAVVRAPEALAAARAVGQLAQSGAFGLLVLDLGERNTLPEALLGRLMQQAQRHDAAIVCLTEKSPRMPSLGALVSLRAQARRRRTGEGAFAFTLDVLKDKRRGPGWWHEEECRGPDGVR